ncbi:hypothetical protein [Pontibacter sp. SGAir0037]|uniref:hypothetical protein n=1 Tax=Pontibacter sp. SGAir0037 TaxID=2571030 RepID=UPI0010CCDF04|nr:hypothetical protein [Pontibacter sp. SGAir0037]QCR23736.1 hypothetical protein C1N53_16210 [Pontibacter sp. SGAir0037]
MKKSVLRYTTDSPDATVKLIGVVMFAAGVYVTIHTSYFGIVLLVLGFIPFILARQVEFDLYGGLYRAGYSIAGNLIAEEKPFPGVDCLYLKKNRYTRTMQSRGSSTTTHTYCFDGFIQLSDGVKFAVVQEADKAKALQKLQQMAKDLEVEVRDLTR